MHSKKNKYNFSGLHGLCSLESSHDLTVSAEARLCWNASRWRCLLYWKVEMQLCCVPARPSTQNPTVLSACSSTQTPWTSTIDSCQTPTRRTLTRGTCRPLAWREAPLTPTLETCSHPTWLPKVSRLQTYRRFCNWLCFLFFFFNCLSHFGSSAIWGSATVQTHTHHKGGFPELFCIYISSLTQITLQRRPTEFLKMTLQGSPPFQFSPSVLKMPTF